MRDDFKFDKFLDCLIIAYCVFCSVVLFVAGVVCLSSGLKQNVLAEERKEYNISLDDCITREDFSRAIVSDYLCMNNNTRALSDFTNYYTDFIVSDISYNFVNFAFIDFFDFSSYNTYSAFNNAILYFQNIFGSTNLPFANGTYSFTLPGNIYMLYYTSNYSNFYTFKLDSFGINITGYGTNYAYCHLYFSSTLSSYGTSLITASICQLGYGGNIDGIDRIIGFYVEYYSNIGTINFNAMYSVLNSQFFNNSLFYYSFPEYDVDITNNILTISNVNSAMFTYHTFVGDSTSTNNILSGLTVYYISGYNYYPFVLSDVTAHSIIIDLVDITVGSSGVVVDLTDYLDYNIFYNNDYSLFYSFNFGGDILEVSLNGNSLPILFTSDIELPRITLSAPVVTIQNNILSWNSVEYAEYYIIKRVSNNVTYYVDNYTYNSYVVSVNGDYSVQACNSDTTSYIDSAYSNVISVTDFHDTEYSFLLLMSSIMDSILYLFKSFLNYEVLGVNMFGAFGAFLFICLILFFIRKFRGE